MMSPLKPFAPRWDSSWALLSVFWLIAGLVVSLFIWDSHRTIDATARQLLQMQAKNIGDELVRRLKFVDRTLSELIIATPESALRPTPQKDIEDHLVLLSHAMEGVDTLALLNAAGMVTASSRADWTGRDLASQPYFQMALDEANPAALTLSPPFKTELGTYAMVAIKRISGPDGRFAGAFAAVLDPEDFRSVLEGVRSTQDTAVGIVHGAGRVFVFAPATVTLPDADTSQPGTFFSRHKASGQTTSVMTGWSPMLNSERLMVIHTAQQSGLTIHQPMMVSVSQDWPLLMAPWRKQALMLGGFFVLLSLLGILNLFLYQRRHWAAQQAEQSLQLANARFSAFFESAMVGMAATSVEKGWLQVNPALCEMLGYDRATLIEKNWTSLTHPEDLTADVAQFERLVAGEINDYRLEKRYIRSNGDTVQAFVSVRSVRGADARIDFLAVVIEDITERKQAELKTRRALQLMQSFIDHWPGLAYIKDGDARVVMANQAFRSLGFDPAALIGKTGQEVQPGAMTDKIARDDQRVLASGKAELIPDEYGGRHYESRRFVIDDEAGQRLLGGLTMDVTRRYRSVQRVEALLAINEQSGVLAEAALLEFGLTLAERLTASQVACLYFVNDDQQTIEGTVLSAKARQDCHAGQTQHGSIGEAGGWADSFHQQKAQVFNDYASCCTSRDLPAGHVPLVRLVSVPVVEDGKVHLLLGVGNKASDYDSFDVETLQLIGNDLWRIVRRMRVELLLQQRLRELSEIYLKLADAQGQLLQSEKLSAIGQLAAGVAHEINNPIGFVQSNLGTLADYVADLLAIDRAYTEVEDQLGEAQPQAFARVHALKRECDHDFIVGDLKQLLRESGEGLERVARIVQDLKGFSRVGETGWLWADLLAGLETTLNIVRNELKYKAEVVCELVALPPVRCIASQINQVFMNLLLNAGQAIETQGQITLRSGHDGDFVWIEVQDDGCGIAPDKTDRIFEPFYTSKPVGKGTGLGLSLAWGIVQRHQGTLTVTSALGKGSTFRVRLPIAGPTVESPAAP